MTSHISTGTSRNESKKHHQIYAGIACWSSLALSQCMHWSRAHPGRMLGVVECVLATCLCCMSAHVLKARGHEPCWLSQHPSQHVPVSDLQACAHALEHARESTLPQADLAVILARSTSIDPLLNKEPMRKTFVGQCRSTTTSSVGRAQGSATLVVVRYDELLNPNRILVHTQSLMGLGMGLGS